MSPISKRNSTSRKSRKVENLQEQMENCMQAWGIRCSNSSAKQKHNDAPAAVPMRHKIFWGRMLDRIEQTVLVRQGRRQQSPANATHQLHSLPSSAAKAVRQVLYQEMKGILDRGHCIVVTVNEEDRSCGDSAAQDLATTAAATPYQWTKGRYRMNPLLKEHLGNNEEEKDFDPFHSFPLETIPAEEYVRQQLLDTNSIIHKEAAGRALAAHHACHALDGVRCVNCRASLLWNHDERQPTAWKHLICTQCSSVYDIQSTPCSIQTIEDQLFERGCWERGNDWFDYHSVQQELPRGAKQYLVIVQCQESTFDVTASGSDRGRCWPVYVAPVLDVTPRLRPESFHLRTAATGSGTMTSVYSRVNLETSSARRWFQIPLFDVDSNLIAQQVLSELLPTHQEQQQQQVHHNSFTTMGENRDSEEDADQSIHVLRTTASLGRLGQTLNHCAAAASALRRAEGPLQWNAHLVS